MWYKYILVHWSDCRQQHKNLPLQKTHGSWGKRTGKGAGIDILPQKSQGYWEGHILKPQCSSPCLRLLFLLFYFLNFFYCSSTVVSIFPYHSPSPQWSPLPTLDPNPLWFCPCVLHTCSWHPSPLSPNYPFS